MSFYIYVHFRGDTEAPFYVGKGSGRRAYKTRRSNRHWHSIVDKHGYSVEVFPCESEEHAFLSESLLILLLKTVGEVLCNRSNGGEGSAGHKMSVDGRMRMVASVSNPSDTTRQKIGLAAKRYAEQTGLARRMRDVMKGNNYALGLTHSLETRMHLSEVLSGRVPSESHRQNLSKAGKLRWQRFRESLKNKESAQEVSHYGQA